MVIILINILSSRFSSFDFTRVYSTFIINRNFNFFFDFLFNNNLIPIFIILNFINFFLNFLLNIHQIFLWWCSRIMLDMLLFFVGVRHSNRMGYLLGRISVRTLFSLALRRPIRLRRICWNIRPFLFRMTSSSASLTRFWNY